MGAYFGFAVGAGESGLWQLAQQAHIIVLGAMALRGLCGSPDWLAAAWALHVLWDYPLHYFGPGHACVPESYAIACISFDLLVAAYIVIAYRFWLQAAGRDRTVAMSRTAGCAGGPARVNPATRRHRPDLHFTSCQPRCLLD